jgi:hypothetical protein
MSNPPRGYSERAVKEISSPFLPPSDFEEVFDITMVDQVEQVRLGSVEELVLVETPNGDNAYVKRARQDTAYSRRVHIQAYELAYECAKALGVPVAEHAFGDSWVASKRYESIGAFSPREATPEFVESLATCAAKSYLFGHYDIQPDNMVVTSKNDFVFIDLKVFVNLHPLRMVHRLQHTLQYFGIHSDAIELIGRRAADLASALLSERPTHISDDAYSVLIPQAKYVQALFPWRRTGNGNDISQYSTVPPDAPTWASLNQYNRPRRKWLQEERVIEETLPPESEFE